MQMLGQSWSVCWDVIVVFWPHIHFQKTQKMYTLPQHLPANVEPDVLICTSVRHHKHFEQYRTEDGTFVEPVQYKHK